MASVEMYGVQSTYSAAIEQIPAEIPWCGVPKTSSLCPNHRTVSWLFVQQMT